MTIVLIIIVVIILVAVLLFIVGFNKLRKADISAQEALVASMCNSHGGPTSFPIWWRPSRVMRATRRRSSRTSPLLAHE